MLLFLIFVLCVVGLIGFRWWSKNQTRQKLLSASLNDQQRAIVLNEVPLYQKVPDALYEKLEGKINLFLHQIEFVGCNGLEVTERMRLSIAAQACLLIANKEMWYKNLRTILIYPSAFKSRTMEHDGYVVTERETVRTGESWSRGPVVLSWAHTTEGAAYNDGQNVVMHEFAHQLDDLSGFTDGAPILKKGHNFSEWDRVFTEAYRRLVAHVESAQKTFINPYGASSPVEYFAVVVELFFEMPVSLQREEPEVYEQLSRFFELEPSTWG